MSDILIEATNSTPFVQFMTDGKLIMKGRSLPSNVSLFYQPLIEWARQLHAKKVELTVDLDYINSASSKKLLELLKVIDANNRVVSFTVYWHYEDDDEDILEKGQIFEESMSKAIFKYFEFTVTHKPM
jgi:hypothetical protein